MPYVWKKNESKQFTDSPPLYGIKCLGVYFDENWLMQNHITYLKKYCYCQLHYLYSVRKYLSTSVILVKGVILSKIDFCNAVSFNFPKYQLLKIRKIINSCLRYIYSLSYDTEFLRIT